MNNLATRQKVGLVMTGLLALVNVPSMFTPTPEGEGPPLSVLVIDSILGVVGLVAVIIAWRARSRPALRVAAGSIIIIAITALPAFFVDVPAWVQLMVAASIVYTVAAVILMFSGERRLSPALD